MLRLVGVGVGVEEFQWSEDEQVWPFEKASDGSTLYCKEYKNVGQMPNTGAMYIAHGLPGDIEDYILYKATVSISNSSGELRYTFPHFSSMVGLTPVGLDIYTTTNWSVYSGDRVRIIYSRDEDQ